MKSVISTSKARQVTSLKRGITRSLKKQGFVVKNRVIQPLHELDKAALRNLHSTAVKHRLREEAPYVRTQESELLEYIANGSDVQVNAIRPRLVAVTPNSPESSLFRYLQLHWSIPVSRGYGRRLRFLVFDQSNDKVMGLIGLGDPVYSLGVRDKWIGWDAETKKEKLYHVMDAYVLGAVPPYSHLLGSKLMALLALSSEVRAAYKKKYRNRESVLRREVRPPYLALITTSSALGRSSIYNRLKLDGSVSWERLGYTGGSGDFHFANGLYKKIREFAELHCEPTAKAAEWGTGFRNKREVIGKCLGELGLPNRLAYHNVSREVFGAPCGGKALEFLRGEVAQPKLYNWSVDDLFERFRVRWLLDRAKRDSDYLNYRRETYRLWPLRTN